MLKIEELKTGDAVDYCRPLSDVFERAWVGATFARWADLVDARGHVVTCRVTQEAIDQGRLRRAEDTGGEAARLREERDRLAKRLGTIRGTLDRIGFAAQCERAVEDLVNEYEARGNEIERLTKERDNAREDARLNGAHLTNVNDAIQEAGIHCAVTHVEAIKMLAEQRDRARKVHDEALAQVREELAAAGVSSIAKIVEQRDQALDVMNSWQREAKTKTDSRTEIHDGVIEGLVEIATSDLEDAATRLVALRTLVELGYGTRGS